VAHLQAFAQRVERQGRADQLGQPQHEELEIAEVGHPLQTRDLFAHQQRAIFPRPAARFDLRAGEVRLRKTAQREQITQLPDTPQLQLGDGQRVHA
jgi:hypothetical protein